MTNPFYRIQVEDISDDFLKAYDLAISQANKSVQDMSNNLVRTLTLVSDFQTKLKPYYSTNFAKAYNKFNKSYGQDISAAKELNKEHTKSAKSLPRLWNVFDRTIERQKKDFFDSMYNIWKPLEKFVKTADPQLKQTMIDTLRILQGPVRELRVKKVVTTSTASQKHYGKFKRFDFYMQEVVLSRSVQKAYGYKFSSDAKAQKILPERIRRPIMGKRLTYWAGVMGAGGSSESGIPDPTFPGDVPQAVMVESSKKKYMAMVFDMKSESIPKTPKTHTTSGWWKNTKEPGGLVLYSNGQKELVGDFYDEEGNAHTYKITKKVKLASDVFGEFPMRKGKSGSTVGIPFRGFELEEFEADEFTLPNHIAKALEEFSLWQKPEAGVGADLSRIVFRNYVNFLKSDWFYSWIHWVINHNEQIGFSKKKLIHKKGITKDPNKVDKTLLSKEWEIASKYLHAGVFMEKLTMIGSITEKKFRHMVLDYENGKRRIKSAKYRSLAKMVAIRTRLPRAIEKPVDDFTKKDKPTNLQQYRVPVTGDETYTYMNDMRQGLKALFMVVASAKQKKTIGARSVLSQAREIGKVMRKKSNWEDLTKEEEAIREKYVDLLTQHERLKTEQDALKAGRMYLTNEKTGKLYTSDEINSEMDELVDQIGALIDTLENTEKFRVKIIKIVMSDVDKLDAIIDTQLKAARDLERVFDSHLNVVRSSWLALNGKLKRRSYTFAEKKLKAKPKKLTSTGKMPLGTVTPSLTKIRK